MKKSLLILLLCAPTLMMAQLWSAQTVTVNTASPDSCTTVSIDVQAYMGCINFTVLPGTYTVSGTTITLEVNCTSSFICAGAISYPVTNFSLSGLAPASYTIAASAYLDRVLINTISGGTLNVASCNTVGIEKNAIANISVYPNPTSDMLYIDELGEGNIQVQLFDIAGKEQTLPLNYSNSRMQLDLSKLNAGIYFLQLTEGEEKVIKKILVD